MEPETGRRECWTVTAGNSHGEEESMVGLTLTPQGSYKQTIGEDATNVHEATLFPSVLLLLFLPR